MKKIKGLLQYIYRYMVSLGIDPVKLATLRYLPQFISDVKEFKRQGGKIGRYYPILTDYKDSAGSARGHYFHQDLLVAGYIHERHPERHIDVGSRIDGFVAHVASFRKIEVIDIRPLDPTGHENILFVQADLMKNDPRLTESTDSLSCLHALEHFGLGRYGDRIDPEGHMVGIKNLVSMLKVGGILYLSFPISHIPRVEFNAHRVFHPHEVMDWGPLKNDCDLINFDYVDDEGLLYRGIERLNKDLKMLYGCGIYTWKKRR